MGTLRLILASLVVLDHTSIIGPVYGSIAVKVFFIISGFYMQLLWCKPGLRVLAFYKSRWLRIVPEYYLFALLAAVFASPVSASALSVRDWLLTVMLFGRDFSCYAGHCELPDFPAWSLASELTFYAIAPFILRMGSLRLAGIAALCLSLYSVTDAYFFFPANLGFFLIGALLYRYDSPLRRFFEATKYISFDRFIGNLSYPVYVSHAVLIDICVQHGIYNEGVIIGLIGTVALLTHALVETPVNSYRKKIA